MRKTDPMYKTLLLVPMLALAASPAFAADVVRYKIPNSTFPISAAVEVPSGKTLVFLSGAVPPVSDANAPKDTPAAFGDTKTQTIGVLTSIEKQLKGMGLTMGDVVKM